MIKLQFINGQKQFDILILKTSKAIVKRNGCEKLKIASKLIT